MKSFLQISFFFLLVTQMCFAQWVQLGLDDKAIKEIDARNSIIFALATDGVLYRSTNNGINWLQIVESGAIDIAIAPSGTVFMVKDFPSQFTALLFSSSNYGDIWDTLNVWEQLPPHCCLGVTSMNVSVSTEGIVYCGLFLSSAVKSWPTAIALSTDDGLTWATPGLEIPTGAVNDFRNQSVLSAGTNGVLMRGELYESKVKNLIFAGNDDGWCEHIYLSSDNGHSWSFLGHSPNEYPLSFYCTALSLCSNGNILMGGRSFEGGAEGLYLSTDSCSTWVRASTMIPQTGLSIESGGMLVGTDSLGVFLFSDNGDSLGPFNEGLTNLNIQSLAIDNNYNVYIGKDNGVWRRPLSEIVPVELNSFTATATGKEVTLSWSTATELNNQGFEVQRKFSSNDFLTIGSVKGHGTTTSPNNYTYIDKLTDAGKYFYRLKQIDFGGKYEYSQTVEINWSPFTTYKLEQNYPNPFNPTTTIGFGIPEKGNVRLSVLNILGEEIKVLLNEEKESGYHSVGFDASDLPSGVYFYQIRTGSFVQTKQMLLLK
jgi:hypothetical protein